VECVGDESPRAHDGNKTADHLDPHPSERTVPDKPAVAGAFVENARTNASEKGDNADNQRKPGHIDAAAGKDGGEVGAQPAADGYSRCQAGYFARHNPKLGNQHRDEPDPDEQPKTIGRKG